MLTQQKILKTLKELLPVLQQKYRVERIGLFGSFSSGNATENSDIDLIVSFSDPVGIEYFSLGIYLEQIFEKKVDLVTKSALKPVMKETVLKSAIYV